jgi:DNA-binding CsgD family transcriptional regulator
VLATRPVSSESRLPFVTLGDLFGGDLDQVLSILPRGERDVLGAALLRLQYDGELDTRDVCRATSAALQALVTSAPTLVVIDDANLVDSDSARAIGLALRRCAGKNLVVVAACRDGERPQVLHELPAGLVDNVEISGLSPADIQTLLGAQVRAGIPMPVAKRITRATRGNPLVALEVGRHLQPEALPGPNDPLPFPAALEAIAQQRLMALSPEAFAVAVVTALALPPRREVVLNASRDRAGAESGLTTCVRTELIVADEDELAFVHPTFAAAVLTVISDEERADAYRRLANVTPVGDAKTRYRALGQTEPDEAIAAEVVVLAEQAHRQGAPDAAAAFYELAAGLMPASPRQLELRRTAALCHLDSGDVPRARSLLRGLVQEAAPGAFRSSILNWTVQLDWNDLQLARSLSGQALAEANDDEREALAAHDSLTWVEINTRGASDDALTHATASLEIAERIDDPHALATAHTAMAEICFYTGDSAWRWMSDLAVEAERAALLPSFAAPRVMLAWRLVRGHELDDARTLLEEVIKEARVRGAVWSTWSPSILLAELETRAGNWLDARRALDEGSQMAFGTGSRFAKLRALSVGALLETRVGDPAIARRLATEALQLSEDAGTVYFTSFNRATLGSVELAAGDPQAAMRWYDGLPDRSRDACIVDPALEPFWPGMFFALTAVGESDRADVLAQELRVRAERLGHDWGVAFAAIGHGLAAAARGSGEQAEQLLSESLESLSGHQHHLERGWTWVALGRTLRARKQKRRARDAFEHARKIFDDMGSVQWLERVELETERAVARPAPNELTATERAVAHLIVDGRSNAQIAAQLYVSLSTVEGYVSQIYDKTGVTSRRELVRLDRGGQRLTSLA